MDPVAEAICRDRIGACVTGDRWFIQRRPFLATFGEDYEGYFADLLAEGLGEALGWKPQGAVHLAAMCNDPIDHRILGEACVEILCAFHGVIDFGGAIMGARQPRGSAEPPERVENPDGLAGLLWVTWFGNASGVLLPHHFGDALLLQALLKRPGFRLLK
jgi:hypothetical protein